MTRAPLLALLLALAVSGCETVAGFQRDMDKAWTGLKNTGNSITKTDDAQPTALSAPIASGCPSISIMPELKTLSEFKDPAKPSEKSLVSEFTMVGVQSDCKLHGDQLAMQVDVIFTGKLGPKAKIKKSDKPNFAYPYFIAVTDSSTGAVVAKEVFAASVSYAADQNDIKQIETLNQTLPVKSEDDLRKYRVLVGFQLDESQLAYNRGKATPAAATAKQ